MRKVAFLLLTACATLALSGMLMAAETWRWKDANGVVHYSDKPAPGAERIEVIAPKPSISVTRPPVAQPRAAAAANEEADSPAVVPYTRCVITSPDNEETFNAVNTVSASLLLEPALQPGHRIEMLLNGNIVKDWPQQASSHTLTNLERGSYTLSARVLDSFGGSVCAGPTINFFVHLPVMRPQVQHR
ncbi:MAG: DUF4124 domain-containing protein [Pseudomonadota bacterium]